MTEGAVLFGEYHFGLGAGHLGAKVVALVRPLGAMVVDHVRPNGDKVHWLVIKDTGSPTNEARRDAVLAALATAGIIVK